MVLLSVLVAAQVSAQSPPPARLSMQGFSGLFDVPSALVTRSGDSELLYTNERDPRYLAYPNDTLVFSLGMLPFLEVGARFTDVSHGPRDLSGNAKLQLPLMLVNRWFPLLALGVQDIGSSVPYFRTKYAVGTEVLGPLELTLGYGTGPDRMKGVFGGGELHLISWASVLGEYDTDEWHAGLRLSVPATFGGVPLRLNAAFRSRIDKAPGKIDFAFGLTFPMSLGSPVANGYPGLDGASTPDLRSFAQHDRGVPPVSAQTVKEPPSSPEEVIGKLTNALIHLGFQNVRVGFTDDLKTVYVELEDPRHRANELDGLAIAFGLAAEVAPGTPNVTVLVRRTGMPMYEVHATTEAIRALLDSEAHATADLSKQFSVSTRLTPRSQLRFAESSPVRAKSYLRGQLVLIPGLNTFLGTEVGAFDALVSFRPEGILSLWRGAVVDAQLDIPVAWTSHLDDGQPLAPFRHPARLDHALLYQELTLAPGLYALLGAGAWNQSGGALGQLAWVSSSGMHRIELLGGVTAARGTVDAAKSALASYRFQWAPLGLDLTATAGRFLGGDDGVQVSAGRDFGDTRVELVYTHSTYQTVALAITLPLSPREDMRQGYLQVRGPNRYHYRQTTTVGETGRNPLHFGIGQLPLTSYTLDDAYLNGDRVGTDYLRANLARLRDAWLSSDDVGISRGLIDPGIFL